MSSTVSDNAIALSSKKINMALDEIIKENKKTAGKQSSAARLKNAMNKSPKKAGGAQKQQNNNTKKEKKAPAVAAGLASPKVKKTQQQQQATKLVSPDKIKIQIQNLQAKPAGAAKKVVAISPKKQGKKIGAKGAASAIRKVTAASPNKQQKQNGPARVVKKVTPTTLNERFSSK
ncbi:hypothetical protein CYY_008276 [Polysphondylium violaceum]|uniref:Uncharacterized protein n=1 Tax=Polysphondylium violaceum TaxID=133409 RepID=A0A8J4PVI3_9MYCE|nr:hypothetical protein CYY_008276 [Polysphondylium violaceum]